MGKSLLDDIGVLRLRVVAIPSLAHVVNWIYRLVTCTRRYKIRILNFVATVALGGPIQLTRERYGLSDRETDGESVPRC